MKRIYREVIIELLLNAILPTDPRDCLFWIAMLVILWHYLTIQKRNN